MSPPSSKGSISHSALDIQKEVARGDGFNAGKAKFHENLCTLIQGERDKGETVISLDLLERLATLWVGG